MPSYDYRCPECGFEVELIHSVAACDEPLCCPECWMEEGSRAPDLRRVISAVPTVGPMPSKPMRIGGIDDVITSNADLRRVEAEHPDGVIRSANSAWFRNHKDKARERAEKLAQKMGYRDLDDKREKDSVAKSKGMMSDRDPTPIAGG